MKKRSNHKTQFSSFILMALIIIATKAVFFDFMIASTKVALKLFKTNIYNYMGTLPEVLSYIAYILLIRLIFIYFGQILRKDYEAKEAQRKSKKKPQEMNYKKDDESENETVKKIKKEGKGMFFSTAIWIEIAITALICIVLFQLTAYTDTNIFYECHFVLLFLNLLTSFLVLPVSGIWNFIYSLIAFVLGSAVCIFYSLIGISSWILLLPCFITTVIIDYRKSRKSIFNFCMQNLKKLLMFLIVGFFFFKNHSHLSWILSETPVALTR